MRHRNLNKRAEIGETITWVFATIIIITILLISIFISSKFFKKGNYENVPQLRTSDIFVTKSLTSYLLTKDSSGEIIFNKINRDEDLDDFNAPLSIKVFIDLYKSDYPRGIWLDIHGKVKKFSGGSVRKKYYEDYYHNALGKEEYVFSIPTDTDIEERIYFGETPEESKTKNLVLFLRR